MELLDAQPSVLKSVGFPWKPITIAPIGDLQVGSEGFGEARFKRYMERMLKRDAYFIGMGDYTDFLSPSNRKYLRNSGLYDTAQELIEKWHMEQIEEIKELLKPTKGRWLGLLQGHHYYEFDPMTTTDTELARYLEAPFLGDCAILRATFKRDGGTEGHVVTQSIDIWAHHGAGSGVSATSALTKLERYAGYVDSDILIMGHQTKRGYLPKPRFGMSRYTKKGQLHLDNRTQHLVAAGGWMEGYHVGKLSRGRPQGSYVEKAMMIPTSLGGMVITLKPNETGVKVTVEGGDE